MAKNQIVDPVKDSMPKEWSAEKQIIAKETMQLLLKHYPKWKWGVEFNDDPATGGLDSMMIRLLDVPSETAYIILAKDIDRDRMTCVITAGGMLLEAHGISRTKNRHDEVNGLKRTPAGLIIPDFDAMPELNPGYAKIKKQFSALR